MSEKQFCTPVIITDKTCRGQRLHHIPFGKPPFGEDRLQELLAEHPELIPINEIEPAFSPLIFLGREVENKAGKADLIYSNPSGYLTIVETKLWSNPESRREAVVQLVDYAAAISNWSFENLCDAVKKSSNADLSSSMDIMETLKRYDSEIDESSYIDSVTRSLSRGNFLLLIIGNGIRESVESITEYIQKAPGLHFTLALVEMNLYKTNPHQDYPIYIQPRITAKTVELVRAVVDIKVPDGIQVSVEIPTEEEAKRKGRRRITEQILLEELAENTTPAISDKVKEFIGEMKDLGLQSYWRSSSVSMRYPDPGGSGYRFTVIVLTVTGTAFMGWLERISWPEYGGYDEGIANVYREHVHKLVEKEFTDYNRGEPFPIKYLLDSKDEYLGYVKSFTMAIKNESENMTEED